MGEMGKNQSKNEQRDNKRERQRQRQREREKESPWITVVLKCIHSSPEGELAPSRNGVEVICVLHQPVHGCIHFLYVSAVYRYLCSRVLRTLMRLQTCL